MLFFVKLCCFPSESIEDAWKMPIEPFKKGDMKQPLACESVFVAVFPRYREKYIKECFPLIQNALSEYVSKKF